MSKYIYMSEWAHSFSEDTPEMAKANAITGGKYLYKFVVPVVKHAVKITRTQGDYLTKEDKFYFETEKKAMDYMETWAKSVVIFHSTKSVYRHKDGKIYTATFFDDSSTAMQYIKEEVYE